MNDEPECWLYERGRERVVLFERLRGGTLRGKPGWTETPLYSPEAAERIKSLLAEVAELKQERADAFALFHATDKLSREAHADRQRMREALVRVANITALRQIVITAKINDVVTEALNPASKEANDG